MDIFAEAEGYLELGMHAEAWESLTALPGDDVSHPRALRVRMFCAFQARHYRMAETLALMLCCAGREIKAAAGVILHQLAAIYNIAGNQRQARLLAKAAIEADPRREGLIRSDPQFPPDFVEKALR